MSKNYLISCASSFFTYIDAYVYILTLNRQILKPPVLGHSITVLSTRNNKWSSPPPSHTHTHGARVFAEVRLQQNYTFSHVFSFQHVCTRKKQLARRSAKQRTTLFFQQYTVQPWQLQYIQDFSKHDSYTLLQHCSANNIVTTSLLISRSQVYSKQNNSFGVE